MRNDKPETVKNRLSVYHEQTQPLIDYYTNKGIARDVDGTVDITPASRLTISSSWMIRCLSGIPCTTSSGMTIAVEPMINMGEYDVYWEDDDWTVVTEDGMPSHFILPFVRSYGDNSNVTLSPGRILI